MERSASSRGTIALQAAALLGKPCTSSSGGPVAALDQVDALAADLDEAAVVQHGRRIV